MSKLLVLSEIDCRDFLTSRGIHPDEFYTDFMLFKNKSSIFSDCDIIILFAGSCHFSKRHVLDIIKTLQKRASNEDDLGIKSVTVVTDVFLPSISKYYKYQGVLSNISEYSGWKLVNKKSDIWDKVPKGKEGIATLSYLTNYDNGDVYNLKDSYKSSLSEDSELRSLIKKPKFDSILDA